MGVKKVRSYKRRTKGGKVVTVSSYTASHKDASNRPGSGKEYSDRAKKWFDKVHSPLSKTRGFYGEFLKLTKDPVAYGGRVHQFDKEADDFYYVLEDEKDIKRDTKKGNKVRYVTNAQGAKEARVYHKDNYDIKTGKRIKHN